MGKVTEAFEQYVENCYKYSAGASCHNAGNLLLRGAALPDGTVPVRAGRGYNLVYLICRKVGAIKYLI